MIEGGGLGVVAPEAVGPADTLRRAGGIDVLVDDEAQRCARRAASWHGTRARCPMRAAPTSARCATRFPRGRKRCSTRAPSSRTLADRDSVLELRAVVRPRRGHRAGAPGRPSGRDRRDPPAPPRRRARRGRLRQARALHAAGRRRRPSADHVGRHAGLHGRAGVGSARDDAPCRPRVRHRRGAARAGGVGGAAPRLRPGRDGVHRPATSTRRWPPRRGRRPSSDRWASKARCAWAFARSLPRCRAPSATRCSSKLLSGMRERGRALNVASHLEIDDVIDPAETRAWLLRVLATARRQCAAAAPRLRRHLVV